MAADNVIPRNLSKETGTTGILAPKILLGSSKATRVAWRRIISGLWDAPDLDAAFNSLALQSLDLHPGPIVLQETAGGWKTDQDLWHFVWLHSCWAFPHGDGWPVWKRQAQIVMAGLQHSWFALGMLPSSVIGLLFAYDDIILSGNSGENISAQEYRREIAYPWLDRMLYWYYDVAVYADRFHYFRYGCDLMPLRSTTWMRSILQMLWRHQLCEFALVERCQFLSPANLANELLASSNIVEKDGRLRINEALMDGACSNT